MNNVSILQVLFGVFILCIIIGLCGLIDGHLGGAVFGIGIVLLFTIVIGVIALWNNIKEKRNKK